MNKLDWKQILMLGFIYKNERCLSVDISHKLRITYSYVHDFLHFLESEDLLVYDEPSGRTRNFSLTDKGRELAFRCYNLVNVLDSINGGN